MRPKSKQATRAIEETYRLTKIKPQRRPKKDNNSNRQRNVEDAGVLRLIGGRRGDDGRGGKKGTYCQERGEKK